MNGDLISRKAVIDALTSLHTHVGMELGASVAFDEACDAVCKIPAVDAEHVQHGRWKPFGTINDKRMFVCSVKKCGCANSRKTNFCPNCGARMDGKEG